MDRLAQLLPALGAEEHVERVAVVVGDGEQRGNLRRLGRLKSRDGL